MATGLPFIDLATATRNWLTGGSDEAVKGEKANDFEPIGPGDPRFDEVYAGVVTATSAMNQQAILNQALAEKKARETKNLMWLLGAGLVGVVLLSGSGGKRTKRRKSRRRR